MTRAEIEKAEKEQKQEEEEEPQPANGLEFNTGVG
jgi:hypothetical protein